MSKVFFGRLNEKYNNIKDRICQTGDKDFLGEIEEGDYAFITVIGTSRIKGLWKLDKIEVINNLYKASFEEIAAFDNLSLDQFSSLDLFVLNSNSVVNTKRQISGKGFFELSLVDENKTLKLLKDEKEISGYIQNPDHYRTIKKLSDKGQIEKKSINLQLYNEDGSWKLFSEQNFISEELKRKFDSSKYVSYQNANRNRQDNKGKMYGFLSEDSGNPTMIGFWDLFCGKDEGNDDAQNINENMNQCDNNVPSLLSELYDKLVKSKNIILHGAPGTGKSYLAHQLASMIISNGKSANISLPQEQKEYKEFVQFHPSYDYTDFVEGIRPRIDENNETAGFYYRRGIFTEFLLKAIHNEKAHNYPASVSAEKVISKAMTAVLNRYLESGEEIKLKKGQPFRVTQVLEEQDKIELLTTDKSVTWTTIGLKISRLEKLLSSEIKDLSDVANFFEKEYHLQYRRREDSYYFALYKEIKTEIDNSKSQEKNNYERKNYVFIIDEINRGEISKIFGELFFSLDPGYRGKEDFAVSTQYSNMQNTKLDIPDNVYIIGTMNDIDRSVDTFDFAMRRRFRFIEIEPKQTQFMLDDLKLSSDKIAEIKEKMDKINAIIDKELGPAYQIGAAYFKKDELVNNGEYDYDTLWTDYLCPLINEYLRGFSTENDISKYNVFINEA